MAKPRMRFIKPVYMLSGERGNRQRRKVMSALGTIRQDEFFLAHREGLKPKVMIYVRAQDYKDEKLVEFEGKALTIYRTYYNHEQGIVELYLMEKKGEQ